MAANSHRCKQLNFDVTSNGNTPLIISDYVIATSSTHHKQETSIFHQCIGFLFELLGHIPKPKKPSVPYAAFIYLVCKVTIKISDVNNQSVS